MKPRSLKLNKAHKGCGGGGGLRCSVVWGSDGRHIVTASPSDPAALIHYVDQPTMSPKALQNHKDGVTALAVSPDSRSLASGSIDHSVKLYSFPGGEFRSNVTRFTLPIQSLAFNKTGSLLAAAGDDDGIKLIATVDNSISWVLKGHKSPVTGLSFDPNNEFLASIDALGTVIYWELSSGNMVHTLNSIAPNCYSDHSFSNTLSWSPDGETLAVPGMKNDVMMYDRDTADKLFTLKGDHEARVCSLAWSPNGKYMVTSGVDKQVLIWDIDMRQDIERLKLDDQVSCLAWKPKGNSVAVIDVMGSFGLWESVVPSTMKSPADGGPDHNQRNASGLLLFDDDDDVDDDGKEANSGSLDDDVDDDGKSESHGESLPATRKRLTKQSRQVCSAEEDSDGQDGLLHEIEYRKRNSIKLSRTMKFRGEEQSSSFKSMSAKMQEAFQPGCTPTQNGKRRFLAYTMLGSITSIENDGYSHIEIDFHDTGRGPRVPSMTDYFGFTMASLNENGGVFSNPCKGEKQASTLMYRPFSSWANNSEWSMRFDKEEVKAVALGNGWVAAVTSLNYLRIFSAGGLQRHILCINGPVVTMAGFKDELAIVTHASGCLPSGDQVLEVMVINVASATMPTQVRLSLSPGSFLTWFGFSEEGQLSTFDSEGVLRVFFNHFGGSWLPVFSANKAGKSDEESYWVVGLNSSKLFCIVCKSPESYPLVTPKPVLTVLSLSFPLASSDLGADSLENEFIMSNLHLSQVQKKIVEMSAVHLDTTVLDDEAFNLEVAIDRCTLRLIASCCKGDKLVRATELAKLLALDKSLKGAIKLVTALKLPILAERFNTILEERLSCEAGISHESAAMPSNPDHPQLQFSKISEMQEEKPKMTKALEPCRTTAERKMDKVEMCAASKKRGLEEASIAEAALKKGTDQPPSDAPPEGKSLENSSPPPPPRSRPANPFAKASVNKDKSSLMDSLKKMKKG